MLKRKFGKAANTNYSIPQHIRDSIINRAIALTPALAQIRRVQDADMKARDAAIAQAIEIASGEAEFESADQYPQWARQAFILIFEKMMRSRGWVMESFHLNKVNYLYEKIKWFEADRRKFSRANYELESANGELVELVKKLRNKLVEQDEVINKLISGSSTGKKGLLC